MDIIYNIIFFLIWLIFWWIIIYLWSNFKYNNKENIDKCFKERKEFEEKNVIFEREIKEKNEYIEQLSKELEHSKREIAEKNKYLSEDKVVIERLAQVKELSSKIADILLDYDKDTINHLLKEYKKWDKIKDNEDTQDEQNNKKIWW